MAGGSFLPVPLMTSLLTMGLFSFLGTDVKLQGFSAIVAVFIAYTFISLILWSSGDRLEDFDHPGLFRSRILFYVVCGLLTVMLALIIAGGLDLGLFIKMGDFKSNCIAHFWGFITALIVILVLDAHTDREIISL